MFLEIFAADMLLSKLLEIAWGLGTTAGSAGARMALEKAGLQTGLSQIQEQIERLNIKIVNLSKSKFKTALSDFCEGLSYLGLDRNTIGPIKLIRGAASNTLEFNSASVTKQNYDKAMEKFKAAQSNAKEAAFSEHILSPLDRLKAWEVVFCCAGVLNWNDREMMLTVWKGYAQEILGDKELASAIENGMKKDYATGSDATLLLFEEIVKFLLGIASFSHFLSDQKLVLSKEYQPFFESLTGPQSVKGKNGKLWPLKYLFDKPLFVSPHMCLDITVISEEKYFAFYKRIQVQGRITNMISGRQLDKISKLHLPLVPQSAREVCVNLQNGCIGIPDKASRMIRMYKTGQDDPKNSLAISDTHLEIPLPGNMANLDIYDMEATKSGYIVAVVISNRHVKESSYALWLKSPNDAWIKLHAIENYGQMTGRFAPVAAADFGEGKVQIAFLPSTEDVEGDQFGRKILVAMFNMAGEQVSMSTRELKLSERVSDLSADEEGVLHIISKKGEVLQLGTPGDHWGKTEAIVSSSVTRHFQDHTHHEYKIDCQCGTIAVAQARKSNQNEI